MHLVLDVGNTETVLALFASERERVEGAGRMEVEGPGRKEVEGRGRSRRKVEGRWRVSTQVPRTPDEYVMLLGALLRSGGHDPDAVTRVVLGSVVPAASDVLREAAARLGCAELVVIDASTPLPIVLDVEEPRTVGADRIANTLAASRLFERDCIVVDLGTATTYDCITADGRFQGGVIAPGLMSGKEWLAARTAKLPPVEFIPPGQVIGKRTESCIHSGIFFSSMDAIGGMVERVRAEWEAPDPMVVGTGGLSSLVAEHVAAFDHVDPLLTLIGLEMAGEHVAGAT